VRLYQALSATFTPFYQSDSVVLPFVRDRLVGPLSRLPGVRRLLVGMVAGLILDPRRALGLKPAEVAEPRQAATGDFPL
jgi:salicylate hydroxylase